MRLIKKPNQWSCSITAFAMAMDTTVEQLIAIIGHDGGEIVFPDLPEPMCRRGFHPQELVMAALSLGFSATPFELVPAIQSSPVSGSVPQIITIDAPARRLMFQIMVNTFKGVLEGRGFKCRHAVAFDHGDLFDPDGSTYRFSFAECERRRFFAQCAWVIHPFSS